MIYDYDIKNYIYKMHNENTKNKKTIITNQEDVLKNDKIKITTQRGKHRLVVLK